MKKAILILAGLLVVLAILAVAAIFYLDQIVLKTVNEAGPAALGVPVSLEDAQIRPLRGTIALKGLHLGNPEGYKTDGLLDLHSLFIRIDLASLRTDTVVIREITVDGLVVTYEKGLLNSNLGALIDLLSAGEEETPEPAPEEQAGGPETSGKKVVIDKLSIAGSRMNFSVTGAAALTGGAAIPIPLPPITLTGLGREKEGGLTFVQAVRRVLTAIAGATGTAIAGSGKILGDGAKAVGEGAVNAGKAVVGGAAEAGKAVGDGVLDAGKAVGDTLKNLNPLKK